MHQNVLGLSKAVKASRWFHPLLLLVWIGVGVLLRYTRLTAKTPWTDEFSTMIFSLGHSFQTVPLDQLITSDTLLQPLQPDTTTSVRKVLHHLLTQSNHPPLYFVLTHWWMQGFATDGGLISVWGARSLSALFGVAAIPAIFGLSLLAFRSRLVGQIAAAMMAVSPFAIFIAQEARHYTLATLFVIASLCCFIVATRAIVYRSPFPIWVGLTWVGINTLGVATHYFFALTLFAQALVLLVLAWHQRQRGKSQDTEGKSPVGEVNSPTQQDKTQLISSSPRHPEKRIILAAMGTLAGSVVWIPILYANYKSQLTHWIYDGDPIGNWLEPIGRIIAWGLTMLVALPMEITTLPLAIVIISGLVTAMFLIWSLPLLNRGLQLQQLQPDTRLSVQVLSGFVLGALLLFFAITYSLGADLTLAPRYQFVYYPAVVTLLGAALAEIWNSRTLIVRTSDQLSLRQNRLPPQQTLAKLCPISLPLPIIKSGKIAVLVIWLMGLIGGLTILGNLSYLQNLRSDLLFNVIQHVSHSPVLIATTYQHHGQTGRMMSLAWEFKHLKHRSESPQFLLARDPQGSPSIKNPTLTLQETVAKLSRPLDVWLINFHGGAELEQLNCFPLPRKLLPKLDSYWYRVYRCPAS